MAAVLDTAAPRLRRSLKALAALCRVAETGSGSDPAAIATGLADALVGAVPLSFAFVRLCDPDGESLVEVTRGSAWAQFPEWLSSQLTEAARLPHDEIIADVGDCATRRRGVVIPVGVVGHGSLVAAVSGRVDFPDEIDRLVLSIGASHAATALQRARLVRDRRRADADARRARNELELKVLERTGELRQAAEERAAHLRLLESLDRVNRAIQGASDPEQMISDVLDVVLSIFHCDRAWLLYPCDPAASACRVVMERTVPAFPSVDAVKGELPVDEHVTSMFRAAATGGTPIQFGPATEFPMPLEMALRFSAQSGIATAVDPGVDRQYLFGLHQCSHARVWTHAEGRLLTQISRRLTDGLRTLLMFRNLRMSEARLAEAQRIAHVAYWDHDLDTDDVTLSEEAYRIFGLTRQESRMTPADVRALIHPDDRPRLRPAVEAAVAGRSRYDVEYRMVRPNGEVRVLHAQGDVVRDESGQPRRMFGTVQDITEHRSAERLTTEIFETMPDSAYVVDRSYRLRRVNAVFGRIWHIAAENAVGMHVAELLGREAFACRAEPGLTRCFAGEVVSYSGWVDLPCGRRYRSATFSPLRTAGGDQIDAALVIVRDLTDYVRAADALEEAQAELAHVTRLTMLGEITASIAHEVNQPLAAVVMSGNASRRWLGADPPNLAEARRAVDNVVENAIRASDVVRRIRTLLRSQPPEKARIEIREIIRDTLALTQGELARRRVTVRLEPQPELPTVFGDGVGIQQVLVNLVLNAADAMVGVEESERVLVIRSRVSGTESVAVEVQDCGNGLDPEHLERIFDPFFSTKPTGLGMGLSISRSIVEAHRGRLWVTSNNGPGVTFHFTLPLQDRVSDDCGYRFSSA